MPAAKCNMTWNGVKVTCADVAPACDADCMREKYDEFAELGSGAELWNTCNIYHANAGCQHESKDKKSCCATPVVEDDAAPPRIVPWKAMEQGDGICIPTDADTTDGKVTTTAWQWERDGSAPPISKVDMSYMDVAGGTPPNPAVRL